MAPSRSTAHNSTNAPGGSAGDGGGAANDELFLEPMMGTPLAIYVEKDVSDREEIAELITVSSTNVDFSSGGALTVLLLCRRNMEVRSLQGTEVFRTFLVCRYLVYLFGEVAFNNVVRFSGPTQGIWTKPLPSVRR